MATRAGAEPAEPPARPRWPWALLALAIAWAALVRAPLILNAESHLDSDLAVDGLTLLEATQGHWRWHYPGTPNMGSLPVLLSWPQARLWGVNALTLASGGTVAYALVIALTFLLAWRAFGPGVAAWSLVPLAFGSVGAVWLSGRITGGHLLTAAWHAGAFVLLHACLSRGRAWDLLALGLWCGLGVWLDTMFVLTLAGLIPAGILGWRVLGRSRRGALRAVLVVPAFFLGVLPHEVGLLVDPHDAYAGQLVPVRDPQLWREHTDILVLQCLPRLVAGHILPSYNADPDPATLPVPVLGRNSGRTDPIAVVLSWLTLPLFVVSIGAVALLNGDPRDPARSAVCRGLAFSFLAVGAAFVVNRNIFNSDNYRYIVTLLVSWSIGFGVVMDGLSRLGRAARAGCAMVVVCLAVLTTLDTAHWYQRFGWLDSGFRPVRRPLNDPALAWLDRRGDVTHLYGGYWDVYRLSFLTAGRVKGVPFPVYPNRFPGWSVDVPSGRPRLMIVRRNPVDQSFAATVLQEGGRVEYRGPGFSILAWP